MRDIVEHFSRKEYKYFVPTYLLAELRERVRIHAELDPYCEDLPQFCYQVRSIYLDTPRDRFYFEKLDGHRNRKKLRIRVYNEQGSSAFAFLEIKRKRDDGVYKERARVALDQIEGLLNGGDFPAPQAGPRSVPVSKFVYLVKTLNLTPRVLITYDREAYFGKDDDDVRVTFDLHPRSLDAPLLQDIYREQDLQLFTEPNFIFEIKFNDRLPFWARMVIRDFCLRREAISKYCRGLRAWKSALPRES